jgi:hypothetical protein
VKFLHLDGILRGEGVLFADILWNVVEFERAALEPLDKFSITVANRAVLPALAGSILNQRDSERVFIRISSG